MPTASPRLHVHLYHSALISTYTFIFIKSAPSLRFVLYLHLQIHLSLFHFHLPTSSYFHIDIRISILTSAASLMVLTLTHVTKIYLRGSSQKRFGLLSVNIPLTTCILVKGRTKKVYFKDILLSKVWSKIRIKITFGMSFRVRLQE